MAGQVKLCIRQLREQRGMTQKELAEQMQVSFQTISKWENGVNMPDITNIPKLAELFDVSADVLLGLQPMEPKTAWRKFDGADYWNTNRELFKVWKTLYWNDDYFAFLVKEVWKLDRAIELLELGCGFGFLGMKFMPLLPEGSSYTGIELEEKELVEARRIFADTPYPHTFLKQDLYDYVPGKKYDVAAALYLMSYIRHPEQMIEKMKASLKPGGMILLIDSNMEVEQAGYYSGLEKEENGKRRPDFTEIWESEVCHRERDYRMGIKLPYLLKKAGFRDIQIRISDKVIVYDPTDSAKRAENDIFRYVYEHEDSYREGTAFFTTRGAGYQRAQEYVDYYKRTKEYFDSGEPFAVKTSGLYFVYAKL